MTVFLAIAGKGGTGKTTLAALLIRQLIHSRKGPTLAVDADPNANLNEALGVKIDDTIADMLSRVSNNLEPLPAGVTKDQYIILRVHQSLKEMNDFDLLVMGGPEGPGCYCFINNILKGYMRQLARNYSYILMDNEAGMEHLSRRTASNVDILLITSDPSVRGIRSAGRIKQLVKNLNIGVKKMYLVLGKAIDSSIKDLSEEMQCTGLELAGSVPLDKFIQEYELRNRPMLDLPDNSPAVEAVGKLVQRLGL